MISPQELAALGQAEIAAAVLRKQLERCEASHQAVGEGRVKAQLLGNRGCAAGPGAERLEYAELHAGIERLAAPAAEDQVEHGGLSIRQKIPVHRFLLKD